MGLQSGRPPGPRLTTSRDPHPHLLMSGLGSLPWRGPRSPMPGGGGETVAGPMLFSSHESQAPI